MPVDLIERARRYLAKFPDLRRAQDDPQDSHTVLFTAALALVKGFDLAPADALSILSEYAQRSDEIWTAAELQHKIYSADSTQDDRPRGYLLGDAPEGKVAPFIPQDVKTPAEKPKFQNAMLKEFAQRWRDQVSTAWLADRSKIDPLRLTPAQFLQPLYRPGEYVVVFTNQNSQGQAIWPRDEIPRTAPEGVWFLAQPVDGKVYPNPRSIDPKTEKPKMSRRSEESVKAFRFLVLESDQADVRDWLGALVQLPLAIAAIYTSGKRSIHALIRVDAPSINEWRNFSASIRSVLVTLGADQQVASSAVRLSRLPGCMRGDRLQKLLYLNPHPEVKPICTLPKLRDCVEHWTNIALNFLPYDAGEIIVRHLQNKGVRYDLETRTFLDASLDDCIDALTKAKAERADIKLDQSLEQCLFALEWFSTSGKAADFLAKLKAERVV